MWSPPSRPRIVLSLVAALLTFALSPLQGSTGQSSAANSIQQGLPTPSIHTPPGVNLVTNGNFDDGLTGWVPFATPDLDHIVAQVTDGVLQFYRVPQPLGERSNQAVIFHRTETPLREFSPVGARFDLGNSSNVRKRVSVLIHEWDFSDLRVCTFWLAPHSPLQTYRMRTYTARDWWNTTISFYAATGGSLGGFYDVDNVALTYEPTGEADRTLCDDPTAPLPRVESDSPELIANGDFSSGLSPWAVFHRLTWQLNEGVFQFVWTLDATTEGIIPQPPSFEPAPVVIQRTQAPMAAGDIMTAKFDLGNSSDVRKRVSVLIHQWDFDDLAACTFWLPPHTPLQTYTMRMFATEAWTDAAFSVYAATRGPDQWLELDNVSLKRTPSANIGGKECYEPGAFTPVQPAARSSSLMAGASKAPAQASAAPTGGLFGRMAAERSAAMAGGVRATALRYRLPPSLEERAIQVSTDNETWTTLLVVPPSDNWQSVTLDLTGLGTAFAFIRVQ